MITTFNSNPSEGSVAVKRCPIFGALYSSLHRKRPLLEELNLQLELLRVLWRLAHDQRWISQQQLIFVTGRIDEIGRMTGGWLRQLQ